MAIFIAVFGIFIPGIFIALTDIPSVDKSNISEGVLIFKKIGNDDNILGVKIVLDLSIFPVVINGWIATLNAFRWKNWSHIKICQ